MKRFLKFFVAIVASAMTLFSCEDKELEQILAQIAFDKPSYEIGAEGGQLTVKVLTTVDWTAALSAATSLDNIEGITLAADKGKGSSEPIEIVVNFAVNEGFDRTVKLSLSGGGVSGSCTITQKGSAVREMEKVTVAQFLEKAEDASIYYELKGIVKSITNTDYSNFMMKDIDGDAEILIYGLAYESDVANQKVQLLVKEGIQEGDIITIASTRGSYNGTPEGMNSYYISHEKSATPMLKIDKETYEASASGEVFDLTVTSNIVTWTLSADVDWLSFEPATGNASTTVKVTVAAGEGGTGTITASADGLDPVTCVVTRADLTVLTIAEFLTKPDDPNKAYQIGGIITDIVMDKDDATKPNKYGNFYIKDRTGEAYIYGLLPEKGGASGQNVITEKGLKIGDFVSLAAPKSSYNDAPQGKNAWLLAAYPAKTLTEFLALEDDATKSVFYTVSGTVTDIVMDKEDATKPNKYGNIYIKDADGVELYIYGTLDWEGAKANFASLELKVGDVITGYAYKSSYNGAGQAVNLQPVLIESGEPVVEDKWDYTPSADSQDPRNLWKAVFEGNKELISGNIAGFPDAPVAITEVGGITKKETTYKFHFNAATSGDWSNCNFFSFGEGNYLPLKAGSKYSFKFVIGADKDLPRAFFKINKDDPAVDGLENGYVWETTQALTANTPKEISDVLTIGSDCPSISFTIDFGGNPEDVNIYIKDITIIEDQSEAPVLKFEWRTEADTLVNVPYNQAGAAHWYVEKDAEVEYVFKVYTDDGSVYTENGPGITIEPAANHVAINYAANELAIPRKWMVTATTTANVKNPVLTAILIQGAYEYTDLAKLNADIIADGTKKVDRIINISEDAKLYVTKKNGKNVFAQSRHDWFTGGVLFYGTGLESKVAECNTIFGKVTATTTSFNGVPEITAVTYKEGEVTFGYDGNTWPCEKVTIQALKDNYMKYVNVKTEFNNNYNGVTVSDGFSTSDRNGQITDSTGDIALYVQVTDGTITGHVTGTKLNKIIAWPTFYKTNQQIGLWSQPTDVKSIPGIVTVDKTKTIVLGGDPVELGATTNSTGALSYSTSDDKVVTVSDAGLLTAVAAGTATITVNVAADGKYTAGSAECAVTVVAGEAPKVFYSRLGLEAPADWSGTYLLVYAKNGPQVLSGISETSTKYGLGTRVTINEDATIQQTDDLKACEVTISAASDEVAGHYVMMFKGKYLTWTSGNSLNVADAESDNTRWTFELGTAATGNVIITNVADATRQLWYNESSPRFACYTGKTETTSNYAPAQFFKLAE